MAAHADPVSDYEVDQAIIRVATHRKADESDIRSMMRFAALAPLQQYSSCPNIDFDVINGSDSALWDMTAEIGQSVDSGPETVSSLHIPYLGPHQKVEVRYGCTGTSYTYGYGSRTRTIAYPGMFPGARLDADTVASLLATTTDFSYDASASRYTAGTGEGTLARAALDLIDSDEDWRDLAALLLESEKGAGELAAHVAGPKGRVAAALALVRRAPPAGQSGFVLGLLSRSPLSIDRDTLDELVGAQCSKGRAGALTLWLGAVKGEIADSTAQASVLAKCSPSAREIGPWLARLDDSAQLGIALTALGDDNFASALGSLKHGAVLAGALATVIARTSDVTRLGTALEALRGLPGDVRDLRGNFLTLARPLSDALDRQHADAMTKLLDSLDASLRADTILDLTRLLIAGEVVGPELRAAIESKRAWADSDIDTLYLTKVRERSEVFAPDAVVTAIQAGKISMVDYLVAANKLTGCTTSKETITTCVAVMKSELAALAGVTLTDGFQTGVIDQVGRTPDAELWADLRHFGVDTGPLVRPLCSTARDGRAWNADRALSLARAIDPQAACIASAVSFRAGRARRHLISMLLRGLGVAAAGALAFVFVRKKIPKYAGGPGKAATAPPEMPPGAIQGRLDGGGLQAALQGGLADTQKALAADGRAEAHRLGQLIGTLAPTVPGALAERTRTAARAALATGEVRSLLVRTGGAALYLVLVPGRADEPKTLRRHPSFGGGWLRHAARLLAALRQSGSREPLVALVVFLRADASQGTLLCALHDDGGALVPLMLLDERETHEVRTHAQRHHFTLT
ncbi:MAG: hypothetical protein IT370_38030 [Deltaproteobacteria bacterium]|nr:hypothetical protein [Deltaproteobacteria bacterium]